MRQLPKVAALISTLLAIGLSLYHLQAIINPQDPWSLRLIHLSIGMAIGFLTYSITKKRKIGILDYILAALAIVIGFYQIVFREGIIERGAVYLIPIEYVLGTIAIILVLEFTRRVVGLPIVIIAIAFILYAYFGPYMPSIFAHKGYSIERIIAHLYLWMEGIYGVPIGVSASFVILFIIFGAFLQATKTGDFFLGLATALAGRARGGPAKIAVFASALFGTISGSAVANVVATGSYTIPLMKRIGYRPHFAGAVEATASTGGQIMPPVMGAAAFVMAEMTGIPYITICFAALIPAILYFLAVQVAVHFEAVKTGLRGMSKEEVPSLWRVIKDGGHLIVPLMVLIYLLAIEKVSPGFAAFWSIISAIVISSLRRGTRLTPKEFITALEMGAKGSLTVIAACAAAGIIVGVITLTGLGLRFTAVILELGAGNVLLTLILTTITCYILGMGVPTTAAYIITAVLAAPALVELGVPLLAAHLFVFYAALLSAITPPVALAAYAGAGIAGADPMKTGFTAVRIGWVLFLVPFYFIFMPPLLSIGHQPWEILWATIVASFSIICLSAILQNWLFKPLYFWEHILLLAAALIVFNGELITDALAFALGAFVFINKLGQLSRVWRWGTSFRSRNKL